MSLRSAMLALALATAAPSWGGLPPAPHRLVADLAGILSSDAVARLEAGLRTYEALTGREVAVVTVASLDGEPVEDFSQELFDAWKIGKKGKDDGVLLLFAPNERKVRIQTGYGTEEALPDVRCKDIIREIVVPLYKSGKRDEAAIAGAEAIMKALDARPVEQAPKKHSSKVPWIVGILLAALLVGALVWWWVIAEEQREEEERRRRLLYEEQRPRPPQARRRYLLIDPASVSPPQEQPKAADSTPVFVPYEPPAHHSEPSHSWSPSDFGGGSSSGGGFDFGGGSSGGGGASGDL